MATIPQHPVPAKAFYASLDGLSGVLTRPGGKILFLEPESGTVVTITEADYPHLIVLGQVDLSMQQFIADSIAGGAPMIACQRPNIEVR